MYKWIQFYVLYTIRYMKKIIPFICILCATTTYSFADLALPYEDQCAKSIVTQESKQQFETCMQECLKKDAGNDWMCQKYSCGWPDICLYTNRDKETRSEKYLQAEWNMAQKSQSSPINSQKDMLAKAVLVLLLCVGVFLWTIMTHKKKKKHV